MLYKTQQSQNVLPQVIMTMIFIPSWVLVIYSCLSSFRNRLFLSASSERVSLSLSFFVITCAWNSGTWFPIGNFSYVWPWMCVKNISPLSRGFTCQDIDISFYYCYGMREWSKFYFISFSPVFCRLTMTLKMQFSLTLMLWHS